MGKSIVVIDKMGDALRNSGYKSIDSALAEIIDNSIEAKAQDIFVLLREEMDPSSKRRSVTEIGILDNGTGMEIDLLAECLGIGASTKRDRKGIGRFGVGLPQASMHVTAHVEVYSWPTEIRPDYNVRNVWLDVQKIKSGEQEEIEDPEYKPIPEVFRPFLRYRSDKQYDFTQHGTLVYWRDCDNIKPKTLSTLVDNLRQTIGRKFRHLIEDGTHSIHLISVGNNTRGIDLSVMPNDPLFIMTRNYALGNRKLPEEISEGYQAGFEEPIFELYDKKNSPEYVDGFDEGKKVISIPYTDRQTGETKYSDVTLTFSIVKNAFYGRDAIRTGEPGSKPIGKYVKGLTGISVVRAGREIDFGKFDFFEEVNIPIHRWWGCEISFDPVLDEVFGVASNKQQVELHADKNSGERSEQGGLWSSLNTVIRPAIAQMVSINRARRQNTHTADTPPTTSEKKPAGQSVSAPANIPSMMSEYIAADVERRAGVSSGTGAGIVRRTVAQTDRYEKAERELIRQGISEPTTEQVNELLSRPIAIRYDSLGSKKRFVDLDFGMGNVFLRINVDHVLFMELIEKLDDKAKTAIELLLASLAAAINVTDHGNHMQNEALLDRWDDKLRQYLMQIHE